MTLALALLLAASAPRTCDDVREEMRKAAEELKEAQQKAREWLEWKPGSDAHRKALEDVQRASVRLSDAQADMRTCRKADD